MSPSKRQHRQAARQRIEQAQKRQRHRQLREAEPCPLEREMQGYVDVGRNRPFYLREIGLNDVNKGPFAAQHNRERVPVIRTREE